jgi:hypothetical protein
VAGQLLLIALPPLVQAFVALGGRQPVQLEPFEDPPDPGRADRHLVVAAQIHRDLARPEVVVLPQIQDLADHIDPGRPRADVRPPRAGLQARGALVLVAAKPDVEHLAADPEIPARHRDVAGHFLRVAQHRQAMPDLT